MGYWIVVGCIAACCVFEIGCILFAAFARKFDWPKTEGKITTSKIEGTHEDGEQGVSYCKVALRYHYVLRGVDHVDNCVASVGGSLEETDSEVENRALQTYKPGGTLFIHFDPKSPSIHWLEGISETSQMGRTGYLWMGLFFLFIGAALFWGLFQTQ